MMKLITMLACLSLMSKQSWSAMYPDPNCGKSIKLRIPKFIIGGETAREGQYPWVVSIQWEPFRLHNCSGSIISADVILTSAYCLKRRKPSHAVARAGLVDLSKIGGYAQTRYAKKFILHENFDDNLNNDIGLIKLKRPFDFKKSKGRIGAICISKLLPATEGNVLEVAGWGWKGPDETSSSLLMAVRVPIQSDLNCSIHDNDYDAEMLFCAGEKGKNVCKGDSGGAAVQKTDLGLAFQLGIVSFGDECETLPGYYVRLSFYYEWIDSWVYILSE